jgi:hypothetical protein
MGIPLQRKDTCRPEAVLLQPHAPGHAANTFRKAADLAGRRGRDDEPELSCARLSASVSDAEQKTGDARVAGAERTAARGGEIERSLSKLANRHIEATAGECCLESPKRFFLGTNGDFDDAGRVQAECYETRRIKLPSLATGVGLAYPDDR